MNAVVPPPVRPQAATRPWTLSVIVSTDRVDPGLPATLRTLKRLPGGPPHEVIVVDNGPDDVTREVLERLQRDWRDESHLVVLRSPKGLGAAYRSGVSASCGDRVLLTVGDLPFGTSDVEAVLACRTLPRFAIGSRAHPRSRVGRSRARRAVARMLRSARRAVLGLDVGDPYGTFVIEGELARRLVAGTTMSGAGMTTELVALATRNGTAPVELPVVLRGRDRPSPVRWVAEAARMLTDLVRLRRRFGSAHRQLVVRLPDDGGR